MTKTIWIDWNWAKVYTSKEELRKNFEENGDDLLLSFEGWLDEEHVASDVWDISASERAAIKQEYKQYCDACFSDFVEKYFEAIEIEV